MPELRRDPVVGRWVIISTERARRPSDFAPAPRPRKGGPCVFCGGQEQHTPEEVWALRPGRSEPNTPGWLLRVVPNKFPALRIEGELEPAAEGLYDRMNGVGAHEVVIESPDHDASHRAPAPRAPGRGVRRLPRPDPGPRQGPAPRVRDGLQESRRSGRRLARAHPLPAHRHAGRAASWSRRSWRARAQHLRIKKRCIWCDIIRQERRGDGRIILESDGFMALAPFAPALSVRDLDPALDAPVELRGHRSGRTPGPRPAAGRGPRGAWAGAGTIRPTTSCSTPRPSGRPASTISTGTSRSFPS